MTRRMIWSPRPPSLLGAPLPRRRSVEPVLEPVGTVTRAVESLMLANITDSNGAWIAPPGTTLVQTGDLFDRGDDTQAVFKLFAALEFIEKRGPGLFQRRIVRVPQVDQVAVVGKDLGRAEPLRAAGRLERLDRVG